MVISNLNTKLIQDRLGFVVGWVERLRHLSKLDRDDFLKGDNPAIAESYLRRSLEACFRYRQAHHCQACGKSGS